MHAQIVGNFWRDSRHAHGYFEQQMKVLEFAIIIIVITVGINVYYYVLRGSTRKATWKRRKQLKLLLLPI